MADAIARWREVGTEVVIGDVVGTFATKQRAIATLRPANRAQVVACVKIADELRVPLHPVSRGKNWGYGSRVPLRDGAAILDLSRMDRIVDFDERMAYVTVEPGVSFRQLATFLRTCRARVFASVTGGAADGSVIANALERGDGAGPLGDRFGHICDLEVVLADGSVVHTGFGRFPDSTMGPLARWGVGPYVDGLFSQSGFGIVTSATIWLAPYPRAFVMAGYTCAGDARLPALVNALRALKLAGVTTATVPVWNDIKALSLVGQYPWNEAGDKTPLPPELRARLRERAEFGRWNGTVSLYGASRAHADALRDVVADALAPIADVRFRDGPDDPLDASEDLCGPALGVAHDRSAASAYWRKRTAPTTLDPDADRCGFIWISHAVPFDGTHAAAVDEIVEREFPAHGFEPSLALLGVTERALSAVAAIAYDRDVAGEDERAIACHDRVSTLLLEHGYPPFRLGVQSRAPVGEPSYDRLIGELARALDPHGILERRYR